MTTKRCGYIALLGRPNAGKSTLLNAMVGDKIAVVSRKPQTTRNRILGVALAGDAQVLFLDTPGIHRARRNLINSTMNKVAMAAASEGDLIVYLVDAAPGFTEEDGIYLKRVLESTTAPCLVLLTKIDILKKHEVEASLTDCRAALTEFADEFGADRLLAPLPMTVSAKRPESVLALKTLVAARMPEGPWLFPEDDLTDMPRNFIVSELIREQIFRQLGQELPYSAAVKVSRIEMKPEMVVVMAEIVVSRAAHKPIMLGKGGSRIKNLGVEARAALEQHFDQRVYLDLQVRVAEGWIDDQRMIAELAHLSEDTFAGMSPVILSKAKDLRQLEEFLRFAQDDDGRT